MIIVYAPRARDDLLDMLRYGYLHWGYDRALAFIESFKDGLEVLTKHPKIGPIWSKNNVNFTNAPQRVLNVEQYQVIYEIRSEEVWINAIILKVDLFAKPPLPPL